MTSDQTTKHLHFPPHLFLLCPKSLCSPYHYHQRLGYLSYSSRPAHKSLIYYYKIAIKSLMLLLLYTYLGIECLYNIPTGQWTECRFRPIQWAYGSTTLSATILRAWSYIYIYIYILKILECFFQCQMKHAHDTYFTIEFVRLVYLGNNNKDPGGTVLTRSCAQPSRAFTSGQSQSPVTLRPMSKTYLRALP